METEEVLSAIAIVLALVAIIGCVYIYTSMEKPQEFDSSAIDANILFLQGRVSSLDNQPSPVCSCQIDENDLDDLDDDINDLEDNIEECADDSTTPGQLLTCLKNI